MTTIDHQNKLFELESTEATLTKILLDEALRHSISNENRNYYLSVCNNSENALKGTELIKILQSLGLLVIENKELGDPEGLSSLVSRCLFISYEQNQAKFWSSKPMKSEALKNSFPKGTRCYLLGNMLPKKKISKWKFLTIMLLPLWKRYLILLIFALIGASIGLIPTLAIEPIFSRIVPENRINDLLVIGIAVFISQLVGAYLSGISSFFGEMLENDIELRSYLGVVERFLSAQTLSLPARSIGSWSITFQTAIAFTSAVRTVLVDIPTSVFSIIMNFIIFGLVAQTGSTLTILVGLSLIPALANIFMSWLSSQSSIKSISINSQINQLLYKTVTSIGDLRSLGQEKNVEKEYSNRRRDLNNLNLRMNFLNQTSSFMNSGLTAVLTASILFLYGQSTGTSQGAYLTIFIAFSAISNSFVELATSFSSLISTIPTYFSRNALRDIDDYRDFNKNITQSYSGEVPRKLQTLELISVDFEYQSTTPIIKDFSHLFVAGQSYALVGKPGCGKSSLLKLIGGLYLQKSGQLLINRIPNTPQKNQLVNYHVGFIPQQMKLLGDNIRDFMDPMGIYDNDEIFDALERVQLADFIQQLPMNLDTIVSEFSNDFSAGQIQLMQAARMVLTKPTLILSDEPTSHLNEKQHLKIIDLLNRCCDIHISTLHKLSARHLFTNIVDLRSEMFSRVSSSSQ